MTLRIALRQGRFTVVHSMSLSAFRILSCASLLVGVLSLSLVGKVSGVDNSAAIEAPPIIAAVGSDFVINPLTGDTTGLICEWSLNGRALPGKVTPMLIITAAGSTHAGLYRLRANRGSEVSIMEVPVAVYEPITTQRTYVPGKPLTFVARAWGPRIGIRWSAQESWEVHGTTTSRLTLDGSFTRNWLVGTVQARVDIRGREEVIATYEMQPVPLSIPPRINVTGLPSILVLDTKFISPELIESNGVVTASVTGVPPGMAFDAGTRIVSGTPTALGVYTMRLSARNQAGVAEPMSWTVEVVERPRTDYGPEGKFVGSFNIGHLFSNGRTQIVPDVVLVDVTRRGLVSGYVRIGAMRVAFVGALATYNFPPLIISRFNNFPLRGFPGAINVVLTLDQRITKSGPTFTATLKGYKEGLWEQTVDLHREIQPTQRELRSLAGRFNVLFSSLSPDAGSGFGSLTFIGAKTANMFGTLPDGNGFTTSSPVVRDTQTQSPRIYLGFSNARDSRLHGYVTSAGDTLEGYVSWSMPFRESERLSIGWPPGAAFQVIGSRYFSPVSGMTVLPYALAREGNAWLQLSGGGVQTPEGATDIWQAFSLTTNQRAVFPTPNLYKLKLDLYAPTGFFTGSFTLDDADPASETRRIKRTVAFRGMIVPGLSMGEGFFLLPQLPDPLAAPPTTLSTSPILSGKLSLGQNEVP